MMVNLRIVRYSDAIRSYQVRLYWKWGDDCYRISDGFCHLKFGLGRCLIDLSVLSSIFTIPP